MSVDIHGKWQMRRKGSRKWQDIEGEPHHRYSFADFPSHSLFFREVAGKMRQRFDSEYEEDEIEKALIDEIAREYGDPSISGRSFGQLNDEGYGFREYGYITLEEMRKLLASIEDKEAFLADNDCSEFRYAYLKSGFARLAGMIDDYAEKHADFEFRAIFVFDY